MKPALRILFLLTCISSWSCQSDSSSKGKKSNPKSPNSKLSAQDKARIEEYQAEVSLGRDMASRLLQYYGTYDNPEVTAYVNQVGNYVAQYSADPNRKYMFAILNTEMVNAFACPGGYILVTLGTLRKAKSEAELAMILGHEAAHVAKQHMFKSIITKGKQNTRRNKKAESNTNVDHIMNIRVRPQGEESELLGTLTKYLAQSAGTGLSVLQAAKYGVSFLLEEGLDAELEYEADAEGVQYAIKAGYQPNALRNFLKRLQKSKERNGSTLEVLSKTHPSIKERRKKIGQLLVAMKAQKIVGARQKKRFMQIKNSLPKPRALPKREGHTSSQAGSKVRKKAPRLDNSLNTDK
ncbi:MAG: M48 family metalloprotease [Zetaproteobacteria bacterium]|nr:M48 family metalloprotease [Zetaproteobacteria bacterium]